MKKRMLYLILALFLLIAIVVAASVPRITAVNRLTFEELEKGACPLIWNEYLLQSEGRAMVPMEEAEVVTVSSIWGSVKYYILPCIYSHVDTVPENGQTSWMTKLCLVQSCSDDNNLTARLCRVGVENVHVYASAGENTMFSSKADVEPEGWYDETAQDVWIVDVPDCAVTPFVGVSFRVATAGSADVPNEQDQAFFSWDFDIVVNGKTIRSWQDFVVEYAYINNA